jgi:xylulokinase
MYLLGYDCGTSSIKATVMDAQNGNVVASVISPEKEMPIIAKQQGWAEQNPHDWWENVKISTAKVLNKAQIDSSDIKAIGISYQMHGLICVDRDMQVLRPSIIWCDSRAVSYGEQASHKIGIRGCLENLLNLPGNFTATKLKWVKDNEPDIFNKIYKIMLPGDYIAMKMTGKINTTISGLSEGIFWDFKKKQISQAILDALGISGDLIAEIVPTFAVHSTLTSKAAVELGLKEGTPITYRAGDQPNNALSLNVLKPGEVAATAGTSGVVYGVGNKSNYDLKSRVNTFAHVNYTTRQPVYGVLLCVSGTGILNSWLKHNASNGLDYPQMNELAQQAPIGSDGLCMLPFGNGAERILENKNVAASVQNLNFNIHSKAHLMRASQESIVFALNYGLGIMKDMGIEVKKVKAGNANMFLSPLFREAFATITGATVELYNTDGSAGAARGAGIGAGIYKSPQEAFEGLKCTNTIEPIKRNKPQYEQAYGSWLKILNKQLS